MLENSKIVLSIQSSNSEDISKAENGLKTLSELWKKSDFSPFNQVNIQTILLSNNRTMLKESDLVQVNNWLESNKAKIQKMAGVWPDYKDYSILDKFSSETTQQVTFSHNMEVWEKTERNYFDKDKLIELDEKFDYWRVAPRWVKNINLMLVKFGDFEKINKDNIVSYRNNWIIEFNGGRLGEKGLMKIVKMALFKFNGMEEIKLTAQSLLQDLFGESGEKMAGNIDPKIVSQIWKRFRLATGLRELQNFA